MSFKRLITDLENGLKRKIYSRRDKISISIDEFNSLSKKYLHPVKEGKNLVIKFHEVDKEKLIFILRWYYNLWIDIQKDSIEVFSNFPEVFEITTEVNKNNHPHVPKTFEKGTKMIYNNSHYSACNWLRGIPLWDNKDEEVSKGLKPSCQINYNYIKIAK